MKYLCLLLLLSTAALGTLTPPTADNVPASDNESPSDDVIVPHTPASPSVGDVNVDESPSDDVPVPATLASFGVDDVNDNESPSDDILVLNGRTTSKQKPSRLEQLDEELYEIQPEPSHLEHFDEDLNEIQPEPSHLEQPGEDLNKIQPPPSHLEQLPEDLLIKIASYLYSDDMSFQNSCTSFRNINPALERELAVIDEYRYYKANDWYMDTMVDLLCENRDVNRFDVRLAVEEFICCLRTTFAPELCSLANELKGIMKPAKHEQNLDLDVLLQEVQQKSKKIYEEHEKKRDNPKPLIIADVGWIEWTEGCYIDDWRMDNEIALILSQCENHTARDTYIQNQYLIDILSPAFAKLTAAYTYIQKERQDSHYRIDNPMSPAFDKLVAYLKALKQARREILQEKLTASDLTGYDDDSRMAVVLEKLLPPLPADQPSIKDVIKQARNTLMLDIAVKKNKYAAVRHYVKLGGPIQEESLKEILARKNVSRYPRQMLWILLQHPAVSVDIFSWLLLEVLLDRMEPSTFKLLLKDPRAVRPAIDKAYGHLRTLGKDDPYVKQLQDAFQNDEELVKKLQDAFQDEEKKN